MSTLLPPYPVLLLVLLVIISLLLPLVSGWGGVGHNATAFIATSLLTPAAVKLAQQLLVNGDIVAISSWADNVRTQYPWSSTLHYADTIDWSCTYDYQIDCVQMAGGRCVDSAVKNFTAQLQGNESSDLLTNAIKFLVHFIGDLHQPLHAGFFSDAGGNGVTGYFMNSRTKGNLHSLWDSGLISQRLLDFPSTQIWLDYLVNQLNTVYSKNITQWTTCPKNTNTSGYPYQAPYMPCSEAWLVESAAQCCSNVYIDEVGHRINSSTGYNLSQIYYMRNIGWIEQRLIIAGVRMAYALNNIAANRPDLLQFSSTADTDTDHTVSSKFIIIGVIVVVVVVLVAIFAITYWYYRRRPSTGPGVSNETTMGDHQLHEEDGEERTSRRPSRVMKNPSLRTPMLSSNEENYSSF